MELHLDEAARLMGFEVVEDSKGVEIDPVKEVSMEKTENPRICEVLGVEVGEPFKVEGYNGEYHINDDGVLKWGGQTSDDAIYEAINHPDRIIRKTRFTPEKVADAKALMRILGATGIERTAYGGNLCAVIGETAKVVIDQGLFPSLRPEQAISLSDITGAAP